LGLAGAYSPLLAPFLFLLLLWLLVWLAAAAVIAGVVRFQREWEVVVWWKEVVEFRTIVG
jgi:hypothetical protein